MGVISGTEYSMTRNFMQKSKSSSSVLPLSSQSSDRSGGGGPPSTTSTKLISKSRIFKSRSKSSTRATTGQTVSNPCSWSPQGKCRWKSPGGKVIILDSTNILDLTELERLTLQDVALEKLKTLSLGVDIKIPKEKVGVPQQKPKKRPYLLKKKAMSTGIFESGTRTNEAKDIVGRIGTVFGVSLSQCVATDRLRDLKKGVVWEHSGKNSQNGSRSSVSSVIEIPPDDKGSTESLFWGKRGREILVADVISSAAVSVLGYGLQPPPMSVPTIVLACVSHLEKYGLHTTGIFRVSTSLKRIRQLREEIDAGKEIEFGEEHSPHDVAALLKEFLRDLPEPLLSRELYQAVLKTQRIRNRKQQLEATQHLIQLLPVPNRDTLACLLKFFTKVTANAGESKNSSGEVVPGNKMEGYSLATLIAPNILPCMPTEGTGPSMDLNLTKERRESIDVVNYMITNYSQLFEVSPDLLHDVYLHMMDTNPEAIERIFKHKFGLPDEDTETSSVFEGSECGESIQVDEPLGTPTKIIRRREDILHERAARGSLVGEGIVGIAERTRERFRGKRDSSRDRNDVQSDTEKQYSGAESDTSSTKSTSKWFRRTRPEHKIRTSSDSGSEKIKTSKSREMPKLHETKRANSLESVNIKEGIIKHSLISPICQAKEELSSRSKSQTTVEQSLQVPENYNRRQSSPILEGVITASLKIPVPVPLNIDDTDIPFIEEDTQSTTEGSLNYYNSPQYPHHHHHHQLSPQQRSPTGTRDRLAHAESPVMSRSSSGQTSLSLGPCSRYPSSTEISPPGSPPDHPNSTFPCEEMTARILIGAPSQGSPYLNSSSPRQGGPSLSTITTSISPSSESRSPALSPKVDKPSRTQDQQKGTSLSPLPRKSSICIIEPQPASQPSSRVSESLDQAKGGLFPKLPLKVVSPGGLIKSKTADFEKIAKTSGIPAKISSYSIAPKMRHRSQENILLKQQFLLRQQQAAAEGHQKPVTKRSKEELLRSKGDEDEVEEAPGGQDETNRSDVGRTGQRSLQRSRRRIIGSASSSAIMMGGNDPKKRPGGFPSQPVQIRTPIRPTEGPAEGQGLTGCEVTSGSPLLGTSPSRWKRSEIIASKQGSSPSSSRDSETFV